MRRALLLTLTCALAASAVPASAESILSRYRGITLGDSVQSVADRLQLPVTEVTVVHERPSLVQQLTWRPHRFISGTTLNPEALAEMVLTFHVGRLARIAVTYDRERIAGLTNTDLLEATSDVYGTAMLASTPTAMQTPTVPAASDQEVIGRWRDAESIVVLWREPYPDRVGLLLTSITGDLASQEAIAEGVRLDAAGAPARDLARRDAAAAAVVMRDEKTRRENKATFKP